MSDYGIRTLGRVLSIGGAIGAALRIGTATLVLSMPGASSVAAEEDLDALLGPSESQKSTEVPKREAEEAPAQQERAAPGAPGTEASESDARAPELESPGSAEQSRRTLVEEIVVTATRRETTLQDVSSSIAAFSAEELGFRGIETAEDLSNYVPGLVYGEVTGTPQITIRGIGLSVETGNAEQGVASHIDGVFLSQQALTNVAFGDLERVEVLRGPQGTLYGRNSTGGAINYITRKPTDELDVGAKVGGGSYQSKYFEGYASGPIVSDLFSARGFFRASDRGGFTENHVMGAPDRHVNAQRDLGGRLSLRETFGDWLTADQSYGHFDKDGSFTAYQMTRTVGEPLEEGLFTTEPHELFHNNPDDAHHVGQILSQTLNAKLGIVTLKSVTGYTLTERHEFVDGDGRDFSPVLQIAGAEFDMIQDRDDDWTTVIEEVSASGDLFDRLNYVAGFFFMHETGESIINVLLGPDASPGLRAAGDSLVHPARFERNTSYAFFTDARFSLLPSLRVVGGLRAGVDRKKARLRDDGLLGFQRIDNEYSELGDPNCNVPRQRFSAVSPKSGVEYDVLEDGLLYVQYQEGTKPGGVNANACIQTFDAEKVKAVEGGAKLSFLHGTTRLNASVFHYDYTNYQLFQIEPPATAVIVNAPRASVLGGELEAEMTPNDFLRLNLGLSVLDARYDRFVQDDPVLAGDNPEDLSGNRLSRAPKYTINGGIELAVPIHNFLGEMTLRGEARHVDELYFRQFNRPFDRQDAYTTGDVIALLQSGSGRFALRVFVKNVGDARYILSQLASPADTLFLANPTNATTGAAAFYGLYGPPRTWGLELTAYF